MKSESDRHDNHGDPINLVIPEIVFQCVFITSNWCMTKLCHGSVIIGFHVSFGRLINIVYMWC